jgi:hypothetical protein
VQSSVFLNFSLSSNTSSAPQARSPILPPNGYGDLGTGGWNPAVGPVGFRSRWICYQVQPPYWFKPDIKRLPLSSPSARLNGRGDSRSGGSASANVRLAALPDNLLHLLPLRSRTSLLQLRVWAAGPAATTTSRQPASSAKHRGPTRSPRPTIQISAAETAANHGRDGSYFPFHLYSSRIAR